MPTEVSPLYTIHQYTEEVYKVVAFKRAFCSWDSPLKLDKSQQQSNEVKLASNFSRARSMVLQYAMCNPWEYFFTGTLDKTKIDRHNLTDYSAKLMQFIRDKRKAYESKFQVLLVPEHHADGAWHIHGLVQGLPSSVLAPFSPPAPRRLVEGNFLNWPDYQRKFGFCSLAPIRDPVATAFYISKYVSKDLSQREGDLGKHLYFHSRPLNKAQRAADIYSPNRGLDALCPHEYDFCKVGMVKGQDWTFPLVWDGVEISEDFAAQIIPQEVPPAFDPATIDPFYEQLKMEVL